MLKKPDYFESARQKAEEMWNKFEEEPSWGAPWHQLFKQVQSPRHVVSELLQNANDSGAEKVWINIKDNFFIFEHDGKNFNEDQFHSICRFGFSNKRSLQTIGFRGIGFKSIFSIGAPVELKTPTLSVEFNKKRFTEPNWLEAEKGTDSNTQIKVPIKDKNIEQALKESFAEWKENPLSLLFFENVKTLRIEEQEVAWETIKEIGSNITLKSPLDNPDDIYIHVKSEEEFFPLEAIKEIVEERGADNLDDWKKATSKVEIVFNKNIKTSELYAILPTGVKTELPFHCNAPFMQDPSRQQIKALETSITNRWLLERIGKLAKSAMMEYLSNEKLDLKTRANGYNFMPDIDRENKSLEGRCGHAVEMSFEKSIENEQILLTEYQNLVFSKEAILIDKKISEIWGVEEALKLLDEDNRPPVCFNISTSNIRKLKSWNCVEEIDSNKFIEILQEQHLLSPSNWDKTILLWFYIHGKCSTIGILKKLKIVPVQGEKILYSANEVVRLGEKRLLKSEEDQNFLSQHLKVMNPNWSKTLTRMEREIKNDGKEDKESKKLEMIENAKTLMEYIGLKDASDADKCMNDFIDNFLKENDSPKISELARIAQISAQLKAYPNNLPYVTQNKKMKIINDDEAIIYDEDKKLQQMLPQEFHQENFLHNEYRKFQSCTEEEWISWVKSEQSNLNFFLPLIETKTDTIFSKEGIEGKAKELGYNGKFRYEERRRDLFIIEDYDFPEECWKYWKETSQTDDKFWGNLFQFIFQQKLSYWENKMQAVAINTVKYFHVSDGFSASWIRKFSELPCLPDKSNIYQKPHEICRLTSETAEAIKSKPFINEKYDNEKLHPLLDALGVINNLNTSRNSDELLNELYKLANASDLPKREAINDLYGRIDRYISECPQEEFEKITKGFNEYQLILAEDNTWKFPPDVFLNSSGLNVDIINESVRNLSLWNKVGVQHEPDSNWAIQQLNNSDGLHDDLLLMLEKWAESIWHRCQKWISLSENWQSTEEFEYIAILENDFLFDEIKGKTADFAKFSDVPDLSKFDNLPILSDVVEEKLKSDNSANSRIPNNWLRIIGKAIEMKSEQDDEHAYLLSKRLANIEIIKMPQVTIEQQIKNEVVSEEHEVDIAWVENNIYVKDMKNIKLKDALSEKISSMFKDKKLSKKVETTILSCFLEPDKDVKEFVKEKFSISDEIVIEESGGTQEDNQEANADAGTEQSYPNPSNASSQADGNDSAGKPFQETPYKDFDYWGSPSQSSGANSATGNSSRMPQQSGNTSQSKTSGIPQNKHVEASTGGSRIKDPKTEQAAVDAVMADERKYGFSPTDRNEKDSNHTGYDIISTKDNETRWIEVKGLKGAWDGNIVSATRAQMKCNFYNYEIFWLYVVEHAQDPSQRKIYKIKNPFNHIEDFHFKYREWHQHDVEEREKIDE